MTCNVFWTRFLYVMLMFGKGCVCKTFVWVVNQILNFFFVVFIMKANVNNKTVIVIKMCELSNERKCYKYI